MHTSENNIPTFDNERDYTIAFEEQRIFRFSAQGSPFLLLIREEGRNRYRITDYVRHHLLSIHNPLAFYDWLEDEITGAAIHKKGGFMFFTDAGLVALRMMVDEYHD